MKGSWSSVIDVVTALQGGKSMVQIPVGAGDFCLLQNVQPGPGAHPVCYSVGTGVFSCG